MFCAEDADAVFSGNKGLREGCIRSYLGQEKLKNVGQLWACGTAALTAHRVHDP